MNDRSNPDKSRAVPVTLNCSGGISLGAYMAGVFYELTKEAVQDDAGILIDIVTGASAGAMSGIIATYYLLQANAKDLLKEANIPQTIFYRAWVDEVDIKELDHLALQPQIDEKTGLKQWSVLSGDFLKTKANEWLNHASIQINEQTRPVALMMTLTNLQGLLKENDRDRIRTITNAETRFFLFHPGLANKGTVVQRMWEKVILGGRASGAFPIAFPPVGDDSNANSYNLRDLIKDYDKSLKELEPKVAELIPNIRKGNQPPYEFIFSYTDGGVLDGLPILKGIDVARKLQKHDDDALTDDERSFKEYWKQVPVFAQEHAQGLSARRRKYVYIQPQPAKTLLSSPSLLAKKFSMFLVGLKGLALSKAEHDTLRLQDIRRINEIVENREEILRTRQELRGELEKVAPYLYVELSRIDPTIILQLKDHPNSQLKGIYQALEKQGKPYFLSALTTGDPSQLLASDFLGAFGGFFDRRYREHDFLLGRISGLAWLHQLGQDGKPVFDITTPIPIQEIFAEIETKLLDREPQLKPSQWLRVIRMALRAVRILFIEARNKNFFWQITIGVVRAVAIAVLGTLEIVVISPLIAILSAFEQMFNASKR